MSSVAAVPRETFTLASPFDFPDSPLLPEDGFECDPSCPNWKSWLRSEGLSTRLARGGIGLSFSSLVLDAALAGQGIGLAKYRLAEFDLAAGWPVPPVGTPRSVELLAESGPQRTREILDSPIVADRPRLAAVS